MQSTIQNDLGTITIDNDVVARTAGIAAMGCYGVVGMAARNVRDGLVQLLKKESLTKGVRLNIEDNKLIVDLYIIVEYGTNIPTIANMLMSGVKYKIEETTGLTVREINVFVEGVRVH